MKSLALQFLEVHIYDEFLRLGKHCDLCFSSELLTTNECTAAGLLTHQYLLMARVIDTSGVCGGGKKERGVFYVSQVCLELTITPNWPRLKAILSTTTVGVTLCTSMASCYLHLFYISIFLSEPSRKFTRQHLCVMCLPPSSKTCERLEIIKLNKQILLSWHISQSLMFKCPSQTAQTTVCRELLSRVHGVLVHCSGWLTSLRTTQRHAKCR